MFIGTNTPIGGDFSNILNPRFSNCVVAVILHDVISSCVAEQLEDSMVVNGRNKTFLSKNECIAKSFVAGLEVGKASVSAYPKYLLVWSGFWLEHIQIQAIDPKIEFLHASGRKLNILSLRTSLSTSFFQLIRASSCLVLFLAKRCSSPGHRYEYSEVTLFASLMATSPFRVVLSVPFVFIVSLRILYLEFTSIPSHQDSLLKPISSGGGRLR